jgi:anti-sigma regulatory factor (Ser/Thr protein kinase)
VVTTRGTTSATTPAGTTAGDRQVLRRSVVLGFEDSTVLRPLRRLVEELLPGADEDTLVDAELVCTELVTNALEHARGPRSVHVRLFSGGELRVTVVDASPGSPLTAGRSSTSPDRGRGLALVEAVSEWDVTRTDSCKAVTAMLHGPS